MNDDSAAYDLEKRLQGCRVMLTLGCLFYLGLALSILYTIRLITK